MSFSAFFNSSEKITHVLWVWLQKSITLLLLLPRMVGAYHYGYWTGVRIVAGIQVWELCTLVALSIQLYLCVLCNPGSSVPLSLWLHELIREVSSHISCIHAHQSLGNYDLYIFQHSFAVFIYFFHFHGDYVQISEVSSRQEHWSSTTSCLKELRAPAGTQILCTTSRKRTGWTSQGRTWPSVSALPALRLYSCTSAPRQRTIWLFFWGRMVQPTHTHTHTHIPADTEVPPPCPLLVSLLCSEVLTWLVATNDADYSQIKILSPWWLPLCKKWLWFAAVFQVVAHPDLHFLISISLFCSPATPALISSDSFCHIWGGDPSSLWKAGSQRLSFLLAHSMRSNSHNRLVSATLQSSQWLRSLPVMITSLKHETKKWRMGRRASEAARGSTAVRK